MSRRTARHNGEACIAHTRILAPLSRYDEVVDAIAARMQSVTVGDPSAACMGA
ncbi:aldehyde dehydrogenase family protein [Streptomyces sp. NPDC047515]|uniref:aldehyde dehydrogenase family protein n=1 Tax=Streptomyces sp. NPDC047515 TaxID=3155380 RepID=UPI0033C47C7A